MQVLQRFQSSRGLQRRGLPYVFAALQLLASVVETLGIANIYMRDVRRLVLTNGYARSTPYYALVQRRLVQRRRERDGRVALERLRMI